MRVRKKESYIIVFEEAKMTYEAKRESYIFKRFQVSKENKRRKQKKTDITTQSKRINISKNTIKCA